MNVSSGPPVRRIALGWLAWVAYVASDLAGGPELLTLAMLAAVAAVACWTILTRFGRDAVGVLLSSAVVAATISTAWFAIDPPTNARTWAPAELGYLVFYPLVAVAVVRLVQRQQSGAGGAGVLDSIIGALVFAALGAVVVASEVAGHGELRVVGQLGYLLANLGILGFLWVSLAAGGRPALVALAGPASGLAVLAVVNAGYLVVLAEHPSSTPAWSNAGWPAALLLLALAVPRRAMWAQQPRRRIALLLGSASACMPIALFSEENSPQHVLTAAALALIIVRLGLGLVRNQALVATLEASAITDPLTGLANRTLLVDRIGRALARRRRHGGLVAVMFLDLDDFKLLNDQHGHQFGDEVLVAVARRLLQALRTEDTVARAGARADDGAEQTDTVARLGGDEFVLVLEGLRSTAEAALVAGRIVSQLRAPLVVAGVEVVPQSSLGVALADGGQDKSAEDLLRDADTAMYVAKRGSHREVEFFAAEMHEEVVARAELVAGLRDAVTGDQLCLLYQPQVDLRSGRMVGVEALVRWNHPSLGRLTPDRFIPVAEGSGAILAIDTWVLGEACAQLARWDAEGLPHLTIAVNVSARGLISGALSHHVSRALRDAALAPERLEVEITETAAVEHHDEATQTLAQLRADGVKVAIDDFGQGHSALSRLQTFPIDRLKIDRSFVAALTPGSEHESIAAAMITMAHSLGLEVIAEGIETDEHLQSLCNLGCPVGQGYLFSRPVEPDEIPALAAARLAAGPSPTTQRARSASRPVDLDVLTRTLLAELQRVTDLDSTYVTRIDGERAKQRITHALNRGNLHIPEQLEVDWADTVCRRALESGISYTDDVPTVFADCAGARELGLQTYISVPLIAPDGTLSGTLCGASTQRVVVNEQAHRVMEGFARLIAGMR